MTRTPSVIPAKAGIHERQLATNLIKATQPEKVRACGLPWMPAFARMTRGGASITR